jgi:hypothetical protein
VICRFCRYDFRTGQVGGFGASPPRAAQPAQGARRTNGMAVAALVLGILWLWGLGSLLGLIFGYVGKGEIDRSGGVQSGRGMAVAGIVLGWIGIGLTIVLILSFVAASPEVQF